MMTGIEQIGDTIMDNLANRNHSSLKEAEKCA